MNKLLSFLILAVVATAVHTHELGQGSVRSHNRMIKRLAPEVTLEKRTAGCGSSEWGSSGSWSHEHAKEEEEHKPEVSHPHGHHHHHKHHHHHHHHHTTKDEGKETAATATKPEHKDEAKKEVKAEAPKQEPPKEQPKPKQHHDKPASTSNNGGLLDITFEGKCPHPKATEKHPNGCIEFLNCNINNGWEPPHVKIEHLKIASPDEVVKGDVFKPCAKYLGFFKSVAKEFNIHATILMSIAMQESHCDASLVGPNGEISLMQITPENCRGNCWDVYNNIHLGALELSNHLKHHDGNFLLAAGEVSAKSDIGRYTILMMLSDVSTMGGSFP